VRSLFLMGCRGCQRLRTLLDAQSVSGCGMPRRQRQSQSRFSRFRLCARLCASRIIPFLENQRISGAVGLHNPNSPDVPTLLAAAVHLSSDSSGSRPCTQRISRHLRGSRREALGIDLVTVVVSPLDYNMHHQNLSIGLWQSISAEAVGCVRIEGDDNVPI
jgi:hypothetical protein